jgi:nondiscriminating glutamyl-tRNA synthetase
MSKRHGATSVEQYMEMGYLPEAMVNFLALLGWSPESEEEVLSLEQIREQFSLDRVAKNPAVFDLEKLNWLNGHYIRHTSPERLADLAIPFLRRKGYLSETIVPEQYRWLQRVAAAVKNYLNNMSEIVDYVDIFFAEAVTPVDEEARAVLLQEHVPAVINGLLKKIETAGTLDEETAKGLLKSVGKDLGISGKKVFLPLRVAITGRIHGPELHQVVSVLGAERTAGRLRSAIKWSGDRSPANE